MSTATNHGNVVTAEAVFWESIGGQIASGEVDQLSKSQLIQAREALTQYFRHWSPPTLKDGELRVSVGEQHLRPRSKTLLSSLALYAHSVVIRDPLERWLDLASMGIYPLAEGLSSELRESERLREMIEAGTVISAPYPNGRWSRDSDQYMTWQLAHEASADPKFASIVLGELPIREDLWPLLVLEEDPNDPERDLSLISELPDPQRDGRLDLQLDRVLTEADHKAERLLHAENAGAAFTPLSIRDKAFVDIGLSKLLAQEGIAGEIDALMVSTLADVSIPDLDGLKPREASSVRHSSEAFEEWRQYLRKLLLETASARPGDLAAVQFLVNEELHRVAADIRREVSRSRALRVATKDTVVSAGLSAILLGGVSLTSGSALPLAGIGAGALARALTSSLLRRTPDGYRGVMLRLLRD